MLPKPGIYYFPWEVSAGQVPDGGTLRTFGRLCLYDVAQSRVTLRAQHGSDEHQILVCTKLVEPFQAQVDSMYLVLGELEHQDGGSVVKARVLTCVEGMNLPLLEQAVREQRRYQQERDSSQQQATVPDSCPPETFPEVKPPGDARATAGKTQDLPQE
ncbi:CST complex subunit TEN1 isoform X1 [Panthera pardus]|uniref:CST complex subunit TEN1 n=2 Tax=Panthera TaxID=9688 RepID=A0A8C9D415_PANLE|nr:CST complex subunit TEN1 isoform X1 [Panthera pardus]XP_019321719.1 CST complex subunit TEN1 isoform X1 [Panthera pardus]XP_019321720.1 CST complex subunit TEN1 isoform X1 [Panthera pardus]XP_042773314.1 CST complex subunit TEN1 [Panthera leo]XP_042773315.1 CST complex subunit TEN1 [Panthera leo]XP_042773316.1 CST complex subunit TEN1 [Panthera leo]XP_042773317.1 CST complex subunit TEN1 [Panthera leo]XP_053748885.1 CST complex subunit TEN1 isoform X1 [Panthera pardus]XP_058560180.1 CST 